jgi:hypothetical protein
LHCTQCNYFSYGFLRNQYAGHVSELPVSISAIDNPAQEPTMRVMAPPKKTAPSAGKKTKRRGTLVQLYLDEQTLAALDALREAQRFPPERTQVTLRGLMELLEREGFWPPSGSKT